MSRIVFAIALCIFALQAAAEEPDYYYDIIDAPASPDESTQICYDWIGCFNMTAPWKTPQRPVPPPLIPRSLRVTILYYTRPKTNKVYTIYTYPHVYLGNAPFNHSKPTVLLIHGFANNGSSKWMINFKDVYLKTVDANVMLVNWGPGAHYQNFIQVASNTRVVAKLLIGVIRYLQIRRNLMLTNLHLIGHDLGAHICGYIGKDVKGIARLTALDPTQPAFENYDPEVRLTSDDAQFVDVIHTDHKPLIPNLGFGMIKPVGHVDYYFSTIEPLKDCPFMENIPLLLSFELLASYPVEFIANLKACHRKKAQEYLIEAFKEDDCLFWGQPVDIENINMDNVKLIIDGKLKSNLSPNATCTEESCSPVGLRTMHSELRGIFTVKTNNNPPYCIPQKVRRH